MASGLLSTWCLNYHRENQAMISQLGYLQKHYVAQLSQKDELRDLQKIQVRLRTKSIQKDR
jgi:hypothetical protein